MDLTRLLKDFTRRAVTYSEVSVPLLQISTPHACKFNHFKKAQRLSRQDMSITSLCEYGSTVVPANKLKFILANRKESEMVNNFIKYVEFKCKATITAKQVTVPKNQCGFLRAFSRTVRIMNLILISHLYISLRM